MITALLLSVATTAFWIGVLLLTFSGALRDLARST